MNDEIESTRAQRARRLAEAASHESVTEAILAGSGRFGNEFYLYDKPAVAHLDDGERPHVAVHSEMKGVGVGSKRNTNSPDEGGIAVALFTDRRLLAVLGKSEGDERLVVPYDAVVDADYSTGVMKHRIAVETPDTTYHVWVDSGYDEGTLRAAVELVRDRASGGESAASAPTPGAGAATGTASTARTATSDGGAQRGATTGDGDPEDPIEKLERLKELNEKGVLTDEEFAEKKADLLDQI
jgi:hypothetical protein